MKANLARTYGHTRILLNTSNQLISGSIRFELCQATFSPRGLRFLHYALVKLLAEAERDRRDTYEVTSIPHESHILELRYCGKRQNFFIRTAETAWEFSVIDAYRAEHELECAFSGKPEFRYTERGPEKLPDSIGYAPVWIDETIRP